MHPLFLKMLKPGLVEENTHKLMDALRDNDIEEVRRLIPVSDPKSKNNLALILAAQWGRAECIQLLLNAVAPKINSEAFSTAIQNGHLECVKLLLPTNPSDFEGGMTCAVTHNRIDVLQFLLTKNNQKKDYTGLLYHACSKYEINSEIIDLLYDNCQTKPVIEKLYNHRFTKGFARLCQRLQMDEEKETLEQAVANSTTPSKKRKI